MANVEKSWEFFKCDEETFRILFDIQDKEVKAIFIKRWGKNLDGINTTRELKKSDMIFFNKSVENFRIDIKYFNNLKQSGKDNESIKSTINNKGITMIDRLMIKYDILNDDVLEAIDSLEEKKRTCYIYYYGINRNKFSIEQISKMLNMDEYEINNYIKSAELAITSYIRMKKQSKVNKQLMSGSSIDAFKRPVAYFNNVNKVIKPVITSTKPVIKESNNIKSEKESIAEEVIVEVKKNIQPKEVKQENKNIEKTQFAPIYNIEKCNIIDNEETIIEEINKKLDTKDISNVEKLVLYNKLKTKCTEYSTYEDIDEFIMFTYNFNIDELMNCYINNIDVFENVNEIINQIISYDKKYINMVFNSKYITNILENKSYEEQIRFYTSLNNKLKNKQKSK